MAIKKSDLYASLWASCDELRGGMDASQYKDYVLFIKYVSDKYENSTDFAPPVSIPEGASFSDKKPELDFSQSRAEHDDILGDAYEYLMRHFATESGKSKGQFYTPSEVSRVIAQVIGISPENTIASTTAYDPTCGSGSLLLKVAAQAGRQ